MLALIPFQIWLQFYSIFCTLYFMWDFIVRVMCERECEDSRLIEDQRCFRGELARSLPVKWSMCPTHDWNAKSYNRWWQLVFTSVLRVKPSRETSTKHSVLPICHIWYTKSLPTLYILTLPTYWEECFSERKP